MLHYIKLLIFFLWVFPLKAQPSLEWAKIITDTTFYIDDYGNSACLAYEGGYIIAGYTYSPFYGNNHGLSDAFVTKLSSNGNVEWLRCYGGSKFETANSIISTQDGGYLFCGYTTGSTDGDLSYNTYGNINSGWIVKINNQGQIEWQKCMGDTISNNIVYYKINNASDGGYIVGGVINYNKTGNIITHDNYNVLIIKLTATGEIEWTKIYGGSNDDVISDVEPTADNGFVVSGYTYSYDGDVIFNHGNSDVWVLKLDSLGNIQWQQSIGGSREDYAYGIKQTNDRGYVVCGKTNSINGNFVQNYGLYDGFVVKLNEFGNMEWSKTYGGSFEDCFFSINQTLDNNIVVAGYTESNDYDVHGFHGGFDVWMAKIDSISNLEWSQLYGSVDVDWANIIFQTPDMGLFLCGTSQERTYDSTDHYYMYTKNVYALKLSPEVGIAENTIMPIEPLCYPNPASSEVHVRIRGVLSGEYTVTLYDMQGKPVQKIMTFDPETTLDISQLPQGVYTIRVLGNNMARSERVVKSKK